MSEISIVKLTQERVPEFLAFYKRSFARKWDIVERFENQILLNPFRVGSIELPVPIAIDEAGNIVGQFPLMPAVYYHGGKSYACVFGYDYYVDPKVRGGGAGTKLAKSAFTDFGIYFTAGVSKRAGRIHAKQGLKLAGTSRTWLWLCRPQAAIRLVAERLGMHKSEKTAHKNLHRLCPETITVKAVRFVKRAEPSNWDQRLLNPSVIEFDRTLRFVNWRYRFFRERYALYEANIGTEKCYFVATTYWRGGLHLLSVIDYRSMGDMAPSFRSIVAAGKRLCRVLRTDALQVVSSHRLFDRALAIRGFFRVGQPGELWTNAPQISEDTLPTDRGRIFITLADGDGELNSRYEVRPTNGEST